MVTQDSLNESQALLFIGRSNMISFKQLVVALLFLVLFFIRHYLRLLNIACSTLLIN